MAVLLSYISQLSYGILKHYCDIMENMVIWVAVLLRVAQPTKVMPNFWRAVYMEASDCHNSDDEEIVLQTVHRLRRQTWFH